MKKKTIFFILLVVFGAAGYAISASTATSEQLASKFTNEQLVEIGKNIYQTPGAQTCQKCHTEKGEGGGWEFAADLRKPYTWNSFKGFGGYEALKKDPVALRKKMETLLEHLISVGSLKHNMLFATAHPEVAAEFDWTKTPNRLGGQFDMMMWGVAQPEMKKKVKEVHEKIVKPIVADMTEAEMTVLAPHATLAYVKTFEEANAEDASLPKVWS